MSLSRTTYTGNGVTTNYTIPFSYISKDHIKVYLNNTQTTSYTWFNDTTIQFTTPPAQDVVVLIKRETPRESRLVDFTTQSITDSNTFDLDSNQEFYISQEIIDNYDTSMSQDMNGQWDAQNKLIKNAAHPVDPTDVATKHYVDKGNFDAVKAQILTAETYVAVCQENAQVATDKATEANNTLATLNDTLTQATEEVTQTLMTELNNSVSEAETYANNALNSANLAANSAATFAAVPVGSIHYFPRAVPPTGYLEANGQLISRTAYPDLWAEAQDSGNLVDDVTWQAGRIGSYSTGDDSTTFRIPELRSEDIHGWDNGRGIDTGRVLGSWQASQNKTHNHGGATGVDSPDHGHYFYGDYGDGTDAGGAGNYQRASNNRATNAGADFTAYYSVGGANTRHSHSIAANGGTEARDRNVALLVCIKY